MYRPVEIIDKLYYVGVNDRTKHLFENLWPLPKGVSYNSYLIDDEKVALIDTVDICYSDLYFQKIDAVLANKPIDYLIINHMEPDHSGSIEWLKARYPGITLVGNVRTAEMLKGYYNIEDNVLVINDKEVLSLGKNTLTFYLTPMVHWPETMVTYMNEKKVLFTGDAFGTFGALNGGVVDTKLNPKWYRDEMIRYYANIVGKYGSPVQAAIKKLSGLEIAAICSTHGPIWTVPENITDVLCLYDKLSRYQAKKGVVIAYGSMYGHTEKVADVIASGIADNGIKDIVMHNVSVTHQSDILRDIFKYKGLIVGSPTYNSKLYPGVESLLSAIQNRNVKNRLFGYFGGFTWAGAATKGLKEFYDKMEFELISPSFQMKQSPDYNCMEQAYELGKAMALRLNTDEAVQPHKIDCQI